MSLKGKAYIVGAYEHPTRHAPDKSIAQLHAEVAKGAIEDAGLTTSDIVHVNAHGSGTMLNDTVEAAAVRAPGVVRPG